MQLMTTHGVIATCINIPELGLNWLAWLGTSISEAIPSWSSVQAVRPARKGVQELRLVAYAEQRTAMVTQVQAVLARAALTPVQWRHRLRQASVAFILELETGCIFFIFYIFWVHHGTPRAGALSLGLMCPATGLKRQLDAQGSSEPQGQEQHLATAVPLVTPP